MSTARLSRRRALVLGGGMLAASLLPTNARSRPAPPSRGFNLPGWFDRAEGVAPHAAVLEKLREAGFETVRLPVDGDLLSATMLRRIREGAESLLGAGFAVILDLHPSRALHAALRHDPNEGGARAVRAWEQLRAVVADLPAEKVYPELLNEPPLSPAAWLVLRERLAATVRATCPRHTLVWGPAPDQSLWDLAGVPPLADDNQIAAVHFYAPMAFTHQCQTWLPSPLARISGLPFPATLDMPAVQSRIAVLRAAGDIEAAALIETQMETPWTEDAVRILFGRAARWSRAQDCPIMLGEFGVLAACVDARSRVAWVRAVRRAAEAAGMGWVHWDLDQGFGFIRSRRGTDGFDPAMLAALLDGE